MSTEYNYNTRAANTIADAIGHLENAMPATWEPYDYTHDLNCLRLELSQIASQLERIADHLEAA